MRKKPLVIFGTGELAQLAHYYFSQDAACPVVAFTVDAQHARVTEYLGLPLIPFEEVEERFPPSDHDLFVAVGYTELNAGRARKTAEAKAKGYALATYVSSRASIWRDLKLGENGFIMENTIIQPFVKIGRNFIMWCGSIVSHHVVIGDNCFLASGVTVGGGVTIEESCFLGIHATIREHLKIGAECIIGAGALVLRNTPPGTSYIASATSRSDIPSRRLKAML